MKNKKHCCKSFVKLPAVAQQKPSSPKGNDRSPENKQIFLNSSIVSKRFFSIGQGQPTLQSMVDQNLNSIKRCNSVAKLQKKMTLYNPNVDLVNDYVYTKFG